MITDSGESVKWIKDGRYRYDFFGLSSDEKPMDRGNGSTFLEMDTGKVFVFDRENNIWLEL